jgi:hypothetical protein
MALLWVEIFEVYFGGKRLKIGSEVEVMVPGIGCCF